MVTSYEALKLDLGYPRCILAGEKNPWVYIILQGDQIYSFLEYLLSFWSEKKSTYPFFLSKFAIILLI